MPSKDSGWCRHSPGPAAQGYPRGSHPYGGLLGTSTWSPPATGGGTQHPHGAQGFPWLEGLLAPKFIHRAIYIVLQRATTHSGTVERAV